MCSERIDPLAQKSSPSVGKESGQQMEAGSRHLPHAVEQDLLSKVTQICVVQMPWMAYWILSDFKYKFQGRLSGARQHLGIQLVCVVQLGQFSVSLKCAYVGARAMSLVFCL